MKGHPAESRRHGLLIDSLPIRDRPLQSGIPNSHNPLVLSDSRKSDEMSKTQRELKKANHGKRPASSKARRLKRRKFKT